MLTLHGIKKGVALCILTAWGFLFFIHFADTLEDVREKPEQVDVLVAQALDTPAEQSVSLSEAPLRTPTVPNGLFISTPAILNPRALPAMGSGPALQVAEGPPPIARPPLFQLFSVYRL